LHDNAGLYHALRAGMPVLPVFIFDRNILDELEDRADRRVCFIQNAIQDLQNELVAAGTSLDVRYGDPLEIFQQLIEEYPVSAVFANHDYEPYATARDSAVKNLLNTGGISFQTFKDQVIFEKNEVVKENGEPYTVFTPYARKWKSLLDPFYLRSYPARPNNHGFFSMKKKILPGLEDMGFISTPNEFPSPAIDAGLVSDYSGTRDYPGIPGTSRLGVHLRFGTISIRDLAREAMALNTTFLDELIWREFYQMILWHFPGVVSTSFKPAYDKIAWRNNEDEFATWCEGRTGYPIVDAGMRELNQTGFMHNRARMITASFLTKHLLIDWRWGEAYFAKKLLDYDLAANNGGWQWSAGSGCDAAPYFRIFNPYIQTKKFDPQLEYVRRWVPEFQEFNYPSPIVEHETARKRCLEVYGAALRK
jgi:deoxyribodipyrimidine photo-lyase